MVQAFNLAQLTSNVAIVDDNGLPTPTFIQWWQSNREAIVSALNAILQIPEIQSAISAANAAAAAANAAASTAQTAANTAQASANATTAATSLANSYVTGLTITATDAGTSVTVSISSHIRVYGNGTSVSVNGGTLTGLPYSASTTNITTEYIYYDQPSRAGGAVTYQYTTSQTTAAQVNDRHTVGSVNLPVAAAAPTKGSGVRPPGVGTLNLA